MNEDDDYNEIRKTLAMYPKAADDRDSAGYAALFTEDAVLVSRNGLREGRPAIKAFLEDLYKAQPPERLWRHHFGNHVIDLKGDTAEVKSDMVVQECLPESIWTTVNVVRHTDRMARQPDGRWLFTLKHMTGAPFVRIPRDLPWEV
jgi:uncharacterized protein (TIGR02246 family)